MVEHNKTVLVTGGAKGLGKAIVREFAKEKYNIIINYNSSENDAEELLQELKENNVNCIKIKADISNENEIKNMVDLSIKTYGKIDVLVNNAGICIDSLFQDKTIENFRKTLDTNVIGTFIVSRLVGDIMYSNKYGKIINISSTNGINTYFPMCIDYDASKSAINSLTHNLAIQFAPYVTVNAVAPGFIATDSEINGMDEDFIKCEEDKILVKRVGEPEEVAKLVTFLASDNANFINNQIIKIDGGIYGD